ncbi:MAG: hypothetical protein K2X66_00740, partial [Cyanobacteria bacterium]|nr:hypothetical protein [Cyanobacteriota bacterium]
METLMKFKINVNLWNLKRVPFSKAFCSGLTVTLSGGLFLGLSFHSFSVSQAAPWDMSKQLRPKVLESSNFLSNSLGKPSNRVINADLLRVGISDNSMELYEYPLTKITSIGGFQILDKATQGVLKTLEPGTVATVTRN